MKPQLYLYYAQEAYQLYANRVYMHVSRLKNIGQYLQEQKATRRRLMAYTSDCENKLK